MSNRIKSDTKAKDEITRHDIEVGAFLALNAVEANCNGPDIALASLVLASVCLARGLKLSPELLIEGFTAAWKDTQEADDAHRKGLH